MPLAQNLSAGLLHGDRLPCLHRQPRSISRNIRRALAEQRALNSNSLTLVTLTALTLGGCGYRTVAPPPAPPAAFPHDVEVRRAPPAAGTTRVVLDADGERATVTEILDVTQSTATAYGRGGSATAYGYSETTKALCVVPCMVDLTPGAHVLRFSGDDDRQSVTEVQVGDDPKVVRHAMGNTDSGALGSVLGLTSAILGGTTALIGGALWGVGDERVPGGRAAGEAMVIGGGAALVVGIAVAIITEATKQLGSTTTFAWK